MIALNKVLLLVLAFLRVRSSPVLRQVLAGPHTVDLPHQACSQINLVHRLRPVVAVLQARMIGHLGPCLQAPHAVSDLCLLDRMEVALSVLLSPHLARDEATQPVLSVSDEIVLQVPAQ